MSFLEKFIFEAKTNGYTLIPDFFSYEKAKEFLEILGNLSEQQRSNDILSLGTFNSLLLEPRILELARGLNDTDHPVYYGESNLGFNTPPFREWHIDARGTSENLDAFQDLDSGLEIMPAWRFAIYFGDYRSSSGGLKVCEGSHLQPLHQILGIDRESKVIKTESGLEVSLKGAGKLRNLQSTSYDLIIFNLRTAHSGGFFNFKNLPPLPVSVENQLITHIEPAPIVSPRHAIMFDYGGDSGSLDLYIKWRSKSLLGNKSIFNQKSRNSSYHRYYRDDFKALADRFGIKLRVDRCISEYIWDMKNFNYSNININEVLSHHYEHSSLHSIRAELSRIC
jgi:hypothetical protein